MLTVSYDPVSRVVRAESVGMHTVDEVRTFIKDAQLEARRARRHCGEVKFIINSIGAGVQTSAVAAEFLKLPSSIEGANDRTAVVVPSSLAKLQANRFFQSDQEQAFLSENAAKMWLLASREGQRVEPAGLVVLQGSVRSHF